MPTIIDGSNGITFPNSSVQAAAAGVRTFTTSGAVSAAGLPVVLNTDGTVSTVSNVALAVSGAALTPGATQQFSTANSIAYSPTSNVYVVIYRLSSTSISVIAGTMSGSTITWGTPVVVIASSSCACLVYNAASNSFVVVYGVNGVLSAAVVTVSGTTCTVNTPVTVDGAGNLQQVSATYDPVSGRIILMSQVSATFPFLSYVGVVSGTTSTWTLQGGNLFGSNGGIGGTASFNTFGVRTDGLGTIVFWALFSTGTALMIQVATVSGTAITLGTSANLSITDAMTAAVIEYNPAFALWVVMAIGNGGILISTLLTTNVTSRTWTGIYGSTNTAWTTQLSGYTSASQGIALVYDATAGKMVFLFRQSSTGATYAAPGQITANAVTKTYVYEASSTWGNVVIGSSALSSNAAVYSATAGKVVYMISTGTGWSWATNTTPYCTNVNLIGVSTASAASGASLSCTIIGGVNTNVTGLTTGTNYYAGTAGTLTTNPSGAIPIGRALSATALLVTEGLKS